MKSFFAISAFLLVFGFSQNANSASAIAYGRESTHVNNSASSVEIAIENALEACSRYDKFCKLIAKCKKQGFGAVAVEKKQGKITSVGAVCGYIKADEAKKEALRICSLKNVNDNCKLSAFFKDE